MYDCRDIIYQKKRTKKQQLDATHKTHIYADRFTQNIVWGVYVKLNFCFLHTNRKYVQNHMCLCMTTEMSVKILIFFLSCWQCVLCCIYNIYHYRIISISNGIVAVVPSCSCTSQQSGGLCIQFFVYSVAFLLFFSFFSVFILHES